MKNFFKSKTFRNIIIVMAIGGLIYLVLPKRRATSLPVTYETEKVTKQNIALTVSVSGTLVPAQRKEISVVSQAKVTKVDVSVGDIVKSGQQLAKLDSYSLENNLKKARYNYYSAIYARNQARDAAIQDTNRTSQLQQQVNSANVDVLAAEKALANDQYIKSPIAGIVSAINVSVGNTPSAALPAFIIQSTDSYIVKLIVNQADITKIQKDQEVSLKFSALQDTINGKVTKIYPSAISNATGVVNYYVETSVEDAKGLLADMTVDADVKISAKEDVLTVPSASLSQLNGKYYVSIVQQSNQNAPILPSDIKQIEVTVGINNNTYAEILSGIEEGEIVIVSTNTKEESTTGSTFMSGPPEGIQR